MLTSMAAGASSLGCSTPTGSSSLTWGSATGTTSSSLAATAGSAPSLDSSMAVSTLGASSALVEASRGVASESTAAGVSFLVTFSSDFLGEPRNPPNLALRRRPSLARSFFSLGLSSALVCVDL